MAVVLVTEEISKKAINKIAEKHQVILGTDKCQDFSKVDAVIVRTAKINKDFIDKCSSLKLVTKHGMGLDNIDLPYAKTKNITVTNSPFANLNAVAEHIVMMILSSAKKVVELDKKVREGNFACRSSILVSELKGSTVGFIGLGKIPRSVAKKLSGFEVNLIASDPYVKEEEYTYLGIKSTSAEDVYKNSDFLVIHTPLLESTRHLVSDREFSLMKPNCVLIDACRGAVVDEKALIKALTEKRIYGVALDVFEPEPPVFDNPLFGMSNTILTPHSAALSDKAMETMGDDCAEAVLNFFDNKELAYKCN